jgi:AA9 family protein
MTRSSVSEITVMHASLVKLIFLIELWKNEELIANGYIDKFQLPSDIKAGMYILRTELMALHSNNITRSGIGGGPQVFTHCFNVEIKGEGTSEPAGVKFPGGYKRDEPGIKFNLYANGDGEAWDNYVSGIKKLVAIFVVLTKVYRLFLDLQNIRASMTIPQGRNLFFPTRIGASFHRNSSLSTKRIRRL